MNTSTSAPSFVEPQLSQNGLQPASKSAVAAPKLNHEMEMGSLPGEDPPDDIMHLARTGDIAAMEKLFESGDFDATYSDAEGITPLHWASINNQYAMCKFLLENGAEINKKGGESIATPLQWAAQRCHYYTVDLLLQKGADPLITDAQGYNTLHISTFNGNVLLLVLLLHQGIPVDVLDSYGHTALMWSAYKGFPQCVDLFLRWGASVHETDEQGFTALHWALVKGNPACILKLIEYGADRFAKTQTGKTPAITASELSTENAWHRALKECGFNKDGHPATPPWPGSSYLLKDRRQFVTRFLFFWPFLLVGAVIGVISYTPIYLGLPLAFATGYGIHWCASQVLEYAPSNMREYHKTPWLAGIFAGSLFLVIVNWLTSVMPNTIYASTGAFLLNILFAIFAGLTTFFYAACMRYDPGFVPKMNGIAEQKAVIDELLKTWKFDESNFCVTCMIRTPLRSKHCRRCQRCVARHDHHCPWVYNCIGVNNHRHFFFYLGCLTVGIITYNWLLYYFFHIVSEDASDDCNVLSDDLCQVVNGAPFTFVLSIWITLQLTWVTMLIFTQLVQVSRAMTTYENMFGITDTALTSAFTSTGTPLDPNHPTLASTEPAGHHGHKHKSGMFTQWARLLGVDPFIETIRGRGAATGKNKRRKKNPYSRGCMTNCQDFWCDPAPVFGERDSGSAVLGGEKVDYTTMYESPALMRITGMRTTRGDYEAVETNEV